MKTEIFKSYLDFDQRENKSLNGVSEEFAKTNPDFEKDNYSNYGCWDCSGCSGCSDCSDCSDLKYYKSKCFGMPETPVIENIHQKLLEAVTKEGLLQMNNWHSDNSKNKEGAYCGTTHCRAGWVIALAGKNGVELESIFGTENAAMHIYNKSSPEIRVSPTKFYQSNKVAMADIERCANEEKQLNNN